MKRPYLFNPEKIAYYEKAGWEAYYDKDWIRVLWLMVQLNREAFGMSLPTAMAAAMDVVRASIAFKPVENDVPKATDFLRQYYEKVCRSVPVRADAPTLARLEMNYWIVHRQLAVERMNNPHAVPANSLEDIGPMVDALEQLHAALFGISNRVNRRSAEYRALAAKMVDRITGRYSINVQEDWRQIETYLQQAYRTLETD